MDVWGWIVLYVALFGVVQLLVYRYLRSDEDAPLSRTTPPRADPTALDEVSRNDARDAGTLADPSIRVCPRCGTENDVEYTYCRRCVSPVSAR